MQPLIPFLLTASLSLAAVLPGATAEGDAEAQPNRSQEQHQRPYLGITPDRSAANMDGGVTIARVFPNSTASALGLASGDRITAINGQTISSQDDLVRLLGTIGVGNDIALTWQRDGSEMQADGTLSSLPVRRMQTRELQSLRQDIRELQAEREQLTDSDDENENDDDAAINQSLSQLAAVLNQLPERLEQTAASFKERYPDGTFSVTLQIDIRTHAEDPDAIDMGPLLLDNDTPTDDDEGAAPEKEAANQDEANDQQDSPDEP